MVKHSLFRRGRIWFVDFRFKVPGQRASRRFKISTGSERKADAERIAEFKARMTIEQIIGGSRYTLSQLLERYLEYSRSANGASWAHKKEYYLKRIAKFFGDVKLSEVTPYRCQQYIDHVSAGIKPATVNMHVAVLKGMFTRAVLWEMIKASPARGLQIHKVPARRRFLVIEEIQQLLKAAKICRRPEAYLFIKAALLTGMRQEEIAGMKWADFRGGFVEVRDPKERKPKLVPVPPGLRKELQRLNHGQLLVFSKWGPSAINRTWREACQRAEIHGATFHATRHTFATLWAQGGTSLKALQLSLGHSSLEMTGRYAHATDQDQLDAAAGIERTIAEYEAGTKMGPKKRSISVQSDMVLSRQA